MGSTLDVKNTTELLWRVSVGHLPIFKAICQNNKNKHKTALVMFFSNHLVAGLKIVTSCGNARNG